MCHSGSEARMTLWALSSAEEFSELRAELCSQSNALLLVLDVESNNTSDQLQQLQRMLHSAQAQIKPNRQPALFLAAAVSATLTAARNALC